MDSSILIPSCKPAVISTILSVIGIITVLMFPKKMTLPGYAIILAIIISLGWNIFHQYMCNVDNEETSTDVLIFRLIIPIALGFITLLSHKLLKN